MSNCQKNLTKLFGPSLLNEESKDMLIPAFENLVLHQQEVL
jgi:hypothetical protein